MSSAEAKDTIANNAYVVALIDGSIIKFRDHLLNSNGGAVAAKLLGDAIRAHLEETKSVPDDTTIHIRVFADLRQLSPAARIDSRTRPLASFAASFSRVQPLYDFIDVSDKNYIPTKVTSNFQFYARDPMCKRIFFGVSLNSQYLEMLRAYSALDDKVVLVLSGKICEGIRSLGFKKLEFRNVFCVAKYVEGGGSSSSQGPSPAVGPLHVQRSSTERVCPDFEEQNFCTRSACQFAHGQTGNTAPATKEGQGSNPEEQDGECNADTAQATTKYEDIPNLIDL